MLILLFLAVLYSCALLKYEYNFINNSLITLFIQPTNGQNWSAFSLGPGATITLKIKEDHVYFIYDHEDLVLCLSGSPGTIVFIDK
jgi:predicted AlkP superfamily pyrophosphatase or phosphodiesterase